MLSRTPTLGRRCVVRSLVTVITFAATAAAVAADDPRSAVLGALDLRAGDVQEITLAVGDGAERATVTTTVTLGAETLRLELTPHDLRSPRFRVIVDDGTGLRDVPAPASKTYRGVLLDPAGEPVTGSVVAATVDGPRLSAMVLPGDGAAWYVQPAPAAGARTHVVYRGADVAAAAWRCGTPDPVGPVEDPEAAAGGAAAGTNLEQAEIAFDADFQFYQINLESIENVVTDIENIMNGVNAVYAAGPRIYHEVSAIVVRTCCTNSPYSSNDSFTLVSQLRSEWNANLPTSEIPRDIVHLMTGREISGSTIGRAWDIGTICDVSDSYAFSQTRFSQNLDSRVSLTAHEMGHNWGAFHCNQPPFVSDPCQIMCSGLGGCAGLGDPDFGPGPTSQIISHRNAVTCLFDLASPIPLPFFDDFEGASFPDNTRWTYNDGALQVGNAVGEPSGTRSLNLDTVNSDTYGDDEIRTNFILLGGETGAVASYHTEHRGVETGETLFVEYLDDAGDWIELNAIASDGSIQDAFVFHSHVLPAGAHHDQFRLRFRPDGDSANDEWYVDDVLVEVPTGCAGDVDGSGDVGFSDLLGVLGAWGPCVACPEDLDGDGTVGFSDLLIVLGAWGPC